MEVTGQTTDKKKGTQNQQNIELLYFKVERYLWEEMEMSLFVQINLYFLLDWRIFLTKGKSSLANRSHFKNSLLSGGPLRMIECYVIISQLGLVKQHQCYKKYLEI